MTDLGTLGGNNGEAYFVSEGGVVVGRADVSPMATVHHAFLWENGVMTDLKALAPCLTSTALSVNAALQVVGDAGRCPSGLGRPFFSERGAPMVDLNTLALPGSGLFLESAAFINNRGEITGTGLLPNGYEHAVILVPASAAEIAAADGVPNVITVPALIRSHRSGRLSSYRRWPEQ